MIGDDDDDHVSSQALGMFRPAYTIGSITKQMDGSTRGIDEGYLDHAMTKGSFRSPRNMQPISKYKRGATCKVLEPRPELLNLGFLRAFLKHCVPNDIFLVSYTQTTNTYIPPPPP